MIRCNKTLQRRLHSWQTQVRREQSGERGPGYRPWLFHWEPDKHPLYWRGQVSAPSQPLLAPHLEFTSSLCKLCLEIPFFLSKVKGKRLLLALVVEEQRCYIKGCWDSGLHNIFKGHVIHQRLFICIFESNCWLPELILILNRSTPPRRYRKTILQ